MASKGPIMSLSDQHCNYLLYELCVVNCHSLFNVPKALRCYQTRHVIYFYDIFQTKGTTWGFQRKHSYIFITSEKYILSQTFTVLIVQKVL